MLPKNFELFFWNFSSDERMFILPKQSNAKIYSWRPASQAATSKQNIAPSIQLTFLKDNNEICKCTIGDLAGIRKRKTELGPMNFSTETLLSNAKQ